MSFAYKIDHLTRFEYPVPVSVCHNIVCLMPRPSSRLTIRHAALEISPKPTVVNERQDRFGNITHAFSIEESHDEMTVRASSTVEVNPQPQSSQLPGQAWEQVAHNVASQTAADWQEASMFLFDSPLVARSQVAREYAQQVFTPGRPILDAALELTHRINQEFEYLPGSTHVNTTSAEALADRRGVCQDFAHAQVAALRSIGLPARYVSGYLRTIPPAGQPRLVGVDQSHAWLSVYCGVSQGWVELDPTNAMACGTDHLPLAHGRDYSDVAPIRGAFLGGGQSELSVNVDVALLSDHPTGTMS